MAKPLVIVESPAKARTIAGYLGADFTVMASVGHIRDLPGNKKELEAEHPEKVAAYGRLAGIDPDNHFDVAYVVHKSKKKVVTIAGTGAQAKSGFPGLEQLNFHDPPPERWSGKPAKTAISSPWDLLIHGDDLYIAMAGTHQIWKMPLDEKEHLIERSPEIYFETPHYHGWPAVLVRAAAIGDDELRRRLREAWLRRAPAKLRRQVTGEDG